MIHNDSPLMLGQWKPDERRPTLSILVYGQSARPNYAYPSIKMHAIESQKEHLFKPLAEKGFKLRVLLSTNNMEARHVQSP